MRVRDGMAVACILALAACGDPEPKGQVIARANGVDITRRDLMIEAEANGLPADADISPVRARLVNAIIDRQLADDEALRLGLDRTPAYQAALRRTRALLLRDALSRRLADQASPPSDKEIQGFIADNAQMFRQRRRILANLLILPSSAIGAKGPQDIDHLARSTGSQPQSAVIDTATLTAPEAAALDRSVQASPAVLHQGDDIWVAVKLKEEAVPPMAASDQAALARDRLGEERAAAMLKTYVAQLRRKAVIQIQPVRTDARGARAK